MNVENFNVKLHRQDFMVDGVVVPEETETGIYGLFGKYRCLSNFHIHPVTVDGIMYPCSEAAYMAQKTLNIRIREQFASVKSAKDAKNLGQDIQLRPNWDTYRIHAMYKVLFAKFSQDDESFDVLMSTGTKYIEETNWWRDKFWGVHGGEGLNNLGHTLMTIREVFR